MRIAILVEGKTEATFMEVLRKFLKDYVPEGKMPALKFIPQAGRLPKEEKLERVVTNLLESFDAVIGLTDVYTGDRDFKDASDAKEKMRSWAGENNRFYPHVALHDFEAWLLPYWPRIQDMAGQNQKSFGANPETVNHGNPPAHRLKELFERGAGKSGRKSYNKPRDAKAILKDADLMVAVNACPELKSFINTILTLSKCPTIK